MRRRTIICGLAILLLVPKGPSAQQPPGKIPRIGVLGLGESERAPMFDAFRAGLRDLGYIEGRDIILEFRFAHGNRSLLPELAAELAALPVDVIVAEGYMTATGRVPTVSPVMMNPVELGLAASLARPGGNVTGFTLMHTELNAKRVELLGSAFPQITTVAALVNSANPGHKLAFEQTETAARSMGLGNVRRVEAESAAALRALRPDVFSGVGGVVVVPDGVFYNFRRDVIALLNGAHLPAIYPERDYADDGGLMTYGANVVDNFRRAAGYVDRILKGAKPADLPVEQPTEMELVVNVKAAKSLGLTVPQSLLAQADEVIE